MGPVTAAPTRAAAHRPTSAVISLMGGPSAASRLPLPLHLGGVGVGWSKLAPVCVDKWVALLPAVHTLGPRSVLDLAPCAAQLQL